MAESSATDLTITSVVLPDYVAGVPGHARLALDVIGAPQGARVTRVRLTARVDHAYVGDLVLKLTNDRGDEYLLWDRQGGANDAGLDDDVQLDGDVFFSDRWIEEPFDGAVANQGWALEAWDHASGNTGVLDNMQLWLYYASGSATSAWIDNYGVQAGGWTDQDTFPRMLADVDGDGRDDLVGFGNRAVYVSLSTGHNFGGPSPWVFCYGPAAGGWGSQNTYPRFLGDVDGDGRADIVAFGNRAVYVSLSNGHGFGTSAPWIASYGPGAGGWTDQDTLPRMLGDVNGDGLADIVGCGRQGVYVSLSTGAGFQAPDFWIANFGVDAGGWTSQSTFPRCLADVDGDGLDDLVGFGNKGVYVSRSTGSGFGKPLPWIADYGVVAGDWTSQTLYPRLLADMDGDGDAEIVGFAAEGASVSHSLGHAYGARWLWLPQFGITAGGWTSQDLYPRMLGDVNGDGLADMVGCGNRATYVSLSG